MWMEVALHVNFFMPWTGIPALQNLLKERTSFQAVNFDTHPFQISIHTEIHHIKLPFRASGQNFACLSHFSCIIAACLVSLILLNLMTMEYLVQCIAYAAVHCACCVWLCYILLLRPIHPPQCPVFRHVQSVFFLHVKHKFQIHIKDLVKF